MILPGHLAAGYLATKIILYATKPDLDPALLNYLLFLGTFFGMLPDFDLLWLFYKNGEISMRNQNNDHRKYIFHAPLFWVIIGCLVIFFAMSEFIMYVGVVLIIATLSHFVLDSIQGGIMWLWPLKNERYALREIGAKTKANGRGLTGYWISFIRYYYSFFKPTFWAEVALSILALVFLIK